MECPICDEIIAARDYGVVRCNVVNGYFISYLEAAAEFGLQSTVPVGYREITGETAYTLAVEILHRDTVYHDETMPLSEAERLTSAFITLFEEQNPHFYTNQFSNESWYPATQATCDAGILILGDTIIGTLWVEDED